MKCEDVEKVLPEILDGAPDSAFQSEFEIHLKSCPDCSDLVSDLQLIANEARQLEATEEPAPRVWLRIAAELRAEGLIVERPIKDQTETGPARPVLVTTSPRQRWREWWLAPVAAAILAAGSYVVNHKSGSDVAKQATPATPATSPTPVIASVQQMPAITPTPVPDQAPKTIVEKTVQKTAKGNVVAKEAFSPSPRTPAPRTPARSTEDQQFLSVVSTLSPSMRVTYENQLQAVNADIRETQAYVDRNPGDPDARQHLMDAYQQKELLYQIALDRIQ